MEVWWKFGDGEMEGSGEKWRQGETVRDRSEILSNFFSFFSGLLKIRLLERRREPLRRENEVGKMWREGEIRGGGM